MAGPVISELLQGAKTKKDFQALMSCIDGVPLIEARGSDWRLTGELSYMLRKKGITIPNTDCLSPLLLLL